MSKSNLGPTTLEFDGPSGSKNVSLTATTSTLTFEGASSANADLTGINNVTVSNNIVFNDKQLSPGTKTISLAAPNVVTGSSYSLTLPPTQGAIGSYLKNNGSGSLSWDTIPITSFSYRFVRATTNQSTIGSLVTFEGTSTGEGTLGFSGGVFTLTGGKTYYLQGTVDQITAIASFTFNYRWYDTTNSTYIGVGGSVINVTSITSTNDIAYGVVSPTSTINVQLQITSAINVTSINASATGGPAALVYEIITGTGTIGDVVGPASSTDKAIPRFSGTSGKILQDSSVLLTDTNDIQGAASLQFKQSTNTVTLTPTLNTLTLTGNSGAKVALTGLLTATLATNLVLTETGAGVKTIAIRAPSAVTTTYTMTLPVAQGAASTVLTNDGTGLLSWAAASSGNITGPSSSTDKAMVRWNGITGTAIQDSLVIVSDTGAMSGAISIALSGATSGVLTVKPAATTTSYTVTMPSAQGAAGTYLQNDGSGGLTWAAVTGTGDVVGPASATNNAIARFDTTTGKLLKNSTVLLSDAGGLSGLATMALAGGTGSLVQKAGTMAASYTVTWPATQGSAATVLQNDGTGVLSWATGGNVSGPASSTDNALVRFDGLTGKILQNSGVTLSDTADLAGAKTLGLDGSTSGTLTIKPAATTTSYTMTMPGTQGAASTYLQNNGSGTLAWATAGDVTGPGTSTSNALARYSDTTGKVLRNSVLTATDTGDLAGVRSLALSGATSGVLTVNPAGTTTTYAVTMPPAQGAANTYLRNDGSGNLTWASASTITGPGSTTDTALVRWNGTTGSALSDSGVTLSATQDLGGVRTLAMAGATSGVLTIQPSGTTTSYTLTMPPSQGSASTVLTNNGSGVLSWGAGGTGGTGADYMVGNLTATVFTNLLVGDHAPFNQAYQSSTGTATTTYITLDTTSPYSSGTNTASVGRITLKANVTYYLLGIIKSLAGVDYYGYTWYNSDTNTKIGTRGEGFASTSQAASTSSNPSYCSLTPSVDTRVELRLTETSTGSIVNWYSGSTGYGETMFQVTVTGGVTSSNPYTGATASVAGTQGLVPAPTAGQQNYMLQGSGSWVNGVYTQTTTQRDAATASVTNYFVNTTTKQLEFYSGSQYFTNGIASITTTGQTGAISDRLVLFTPPSSTALAYTLPDPSITNGTIIKYMISKSVTALNSTVTLNAPAGKTVNGVSSFVLACVGDFVLLMSNGTDWDVVDKPTGRLLVSYQTVSGASAITFDNVFAASKYTSYSIELSIINSGGSGGYTNTWRLRSGGASITTANYSMFSRYIGNGIGNQGDATANSSETSWGGSANLYNFTGAGDQISVTGDIANPQSTTLYKRINLMGAYTFGGATFSEYASGHYRVAATTADGWIYTSVSGTISGYAKVYANCE